MRRLALAACALLLGACPPKKPKQGPSSLPGLRVTARSVCALSYAVSVERGGAAVVRRFEEKERERTASGLSAGEATVFLGSELFEVPKGCEVAEVEVTVSAPPRYQLSSSLALDGFVYRAGSADELTQSLWVLGRETELRMLEGAFTAVLIGEAQDLSSELSASVSALESLFGAPVARQLLVLGALSPKRVGRSALLDTRAADLEEQTLRALASLWLTSEGAVSYYVSLLLYESGGVSGGDFVQRLARDEVAARFFCLDVVARSNGRSLAKALEGLMRAGAPMTERAASEALKSSACLGDGLKIAAGLAGLTVSKREVQLTKPAALQQALGF